MDSRATRINGRPGYMYDIDMDELDSSVNNHVIFPPPPVRRGYVLHGERSAYGFGGAVFFTSNSTDDEEYSDADVASSSAVSTAAPSSSASAFGGSDPSSAPSSVAGGVSSRARSSQVAAEPQVRMARCSALGDFAIVSQSHHRHTLHRIALGVGGDA